MKIGIVGWGVEGQSAYRCFGPEHQYLIVNEEPQADLPEETDSVKVQFVANRAPVGIAGQVTDLSYLEGIEKCDKIIYQPTAYFNLQRVFGNKPDFWAKATTILDIFFEKCPSKNIIGVTGTKGKGTTSTLIAKMLEIAGKTVHIGGNIGTPILDLLPKVKSEDWIVWELANFQLKSAAYSPHIAVCLMIAAEHLDWHPHLEDYIKAKANIFRHQTHEDVAIYFANNEYSVKVANYSKGKQIPYYAKPGAWVRDDGMIVVGEDDTEVMPKTQVKLFGEHNLQNICAAITAFWEVARDLDAVRQVLHSFSGLEHRLELVRSLDDVKYYDDSFGTTPQTAVVAMRAFKEPKVMILGGSDKGLDFKPLAAEVIKANVRHAIVIGQTAPKIIEQLKQRGFTSITTGLKEMVEIVETARQEAKSGDVVLLSTGCASFGLFKDYKDRGNRFKTAVQSLV